MATSIVVAAAWVYLTHLTGVIWVYSGLAFGVAIGIGFQYRSQPGTWRIRSYLAAACTAVGLFFAEYFLVRQLAVDQLREEGRFAHGGHVPIFLSPAQMVHVVGSTFHAYPSNYVIWPVTVYCAYAMPSASHKAARKRAAAAGR